MYVLTRQSRPEAALVLYQEYLEYQNSKEKEGLERLDRLWERITAQSAEFSEEKFEAELRAAHEEL